MSEAVGVLKAEKLMKSLGEALALVELQIVDG